ncbi:hypothetical protein L2E82_33752 [Cichorium intybus]|uniref:Uncharacterized protein n=1 Tax=Cichorium intybus TaxID=13427 RepID=A0ACB9BL29_CICIN|nr:hypothetical protein L2E82_33752 [Cichorium intybus]
MDLETVNTGLRFARKRKKWILLITALGFSSYGAYSICRHPSVIKKTDRAMKVLGALASITEFLGDSAETIGVISKDLKEFVQSDSDQIPSSLKQVFKITKSDEFSESIIRVTRSFTVGILRAYRVDTGKRDSGPSFPDRALDKLLTPQGSGFASIVVGSFARNLVIGGSISNGSKNSGSPLLEWVDVIADDKCRKLIGDCIQQFVTTMVTVYLDKTMDINTYDEILSGLTNPKHEEQMRNLLTLICNSAIETFVRTSHQVLTDSKSNPKTSSTISKVLDGKELVLKKLKVPKSKISSTLSVPGNMKFVLDVTGRVTLATAKSFLQFSLNTLSERMKRSCQETYRYLTEKSMIVMTIFISLYLHVLTGPWSMVSY